MMENQSIRELIQRAGEVSEDELMAKELKGEEREIYRLQQQSIPRLRERLQEVELRLAAQRENPVIQFGMQASRL